MCCAPKWPWDPVTLSKEGANSDAAVAAVIVEREEQLRENVGVKGAIVFCDKEGKHPGAIDSSAKQDTPVTKRAPQQEATKPPIGHGPKQTRGLGRNGEW